LDTKDRRAVFARAEELGRTIPRHRKTFWDTHHIHARADGGQNDLHNLQTLCIFCHQDATAEQQVERMNAKFEWFDMLEPLEDDTCPNSP
jgi:5-methylcytosine-specific restriction endonuclease McrA